MKLNRLTVLVTILIVVSVGTNIFTMSKHGTFAWPTEQRYDYTEMFGDSILMYRPQDTESLAVISMTGSVITITNFGAPLNCVALDIHTPDGTIPGPCIKHPEVETLTNE